MAHPQPLHRRVQFFLVYQAVPEQMHNPSRHQFVALLWTLLNIAMVSATTMLLHLIEPGATDVVHNATEFGIIGATALAVYLLLRLQVIQYSLMAFVATYYIFFGSFVWCCYRTKGAVQPTFLGVVLMIPMITNDLPKKTIFGMWTMHFITVSFFAAASNHVDALYLLDIPLGSPLIYTVFVVLLAGIIATPLTWYFMNRWLQDFAYSISIGWIYFAIGMLSALLIAVLTVVYIAWRSTRLNPVEALRYE
jgi:hypothetical protein